MPSPTYSDPSAAKDAANGVAAEETATREAVVEDAVAEDADETADAADEAEIADGGCKLLNAEEFLPLPLGGDSDGGDWVGAEGTGEHG